MLPPPAVNSSVAPSLPRRSRPSEAAWASLFSKAHTRRNNHRCPLSPALSPVFSLGPEKARTPIRRKPSNSRHPEAQDIFHQQVPLVGPAACASSLPSGPPLIPRFGRRSPASDMYSHTVWYARPACLPAIRQGPRATCRSSISTVGRPTSTPSNLLNRAFSTAVENTLDDSLAGDTSQAATGQGVLCAFALASPHQTTARPMDLPQPIWLGHPMSQVGANCGLECSHRWRPCGVRSLSNPPTWFRLLSQVSPFRAASPARARKLTGSTAPRVPFTEGLYDFPKSGWPRRSLNQEKHSKPTPFSPSTKPTLTRLARLRLARPTPGK